MTTDLFLSRVFAASILLLALGLLLLSDWNDARRASRAVSREVVRRISWYGTRRLL